MNGFNQLPFLYKMAFMNGARIECEIDGQWNNAIYCIMARRTPIRIHPEDMMVKEITTRQFHENYTAKIVNGYIFYVPNIALRDGCILNGHLKVNQNLELVAMTEDEMQQKDIHHITYRGIYEEDLLTL